jgi:hypothetical protein
VAVPSLLMVLAVLAVFGFSLFWMIWSERRKHTSRRQIALALGFNPIDGIDEETCSRLIHLHQHTETQELVVQNTSERREGATRFVIFDLIDQGGDSTSTLVDAGVAIFSSDLQLPRFSLIPRVAEKGRLAEIANRFLGMLIEKRSNRIELKKNPHFEERYFLLGDDVPAIDLFLDEYRLSRLSQSTYRHLEADRDCFTYSRFVFSTPGKRNLQADLKRDIAEVNVLLTLFSG